MSVSVSPQRVRSTVRGVLSGIQLAVGIFVVISLVRITTACSQNNDLWSRVPTQIARFVDRYYPNSQLQSYDHSGATYHLRLSNGPGMTFDASYSWVDVDGYGMPLPQVMLFDQLPPALYEYLQATSQLNSVFSMERDVPEYRLSMLNSTITFSAETGQLQEQDNQS